jgi:hypothetical protein
MDARRMKATRNRHIIWLLAILGSVFLNIFHDSPHGWSITWTVTAVFAFSEFFSALCYIEEAIRSLQSEQSRGD